jgi:SAM-dependent methyltransferase
MGGAALFTSSAIFGDTMSNAAHQWNELYRKGPSKRYPDEAVVRIFLGSYPNLKMPKPKAGDSILDVGCGDGCNFHLFDAIGMKMAGTEITREIVETVDARLRDTGETGIVVDMRVGTCADLPWQDASFTHLLTWNSCYYMGPDGKFEDHVAEMARVIKPGGWIVCSIPRLSCFIFDGSEFGDDGYVTVANDPFGLRNGERMRWFEDEEGIEVAFGAHFHNFCHATIKIDMFGLAYNWFVIVAQRT